MEAFMIANDRVVKGRKDLLIVILKKKINLDKLPADLKTYISKRIRDSSRPRRNALSRMKHSSAKHENVLNS